MRATFLSLTLIPVLCLSAAVPARAAVTTCNVAKPLATPVTIQKRTLPDGNIEYYGRYKLALPRQNEDCQFRQLLFNTGLLASDVPAYGVKGASITLLVERGIFHRCAKEMRIYAVTAQNNGPHTLYTVDAEATAPVKSAYYLDISIVGFDRPK